MVAHIYSDFLSDAQQYRSAEKYWEGLWKRLAVDAGLGAEWRHPWLATALGEGGPIFSAVSDSTRRAVQIIQHQPTCNNVELTWWLDDFGEPGVDPIIQQLVISCALSEEAGEKAYDLMWSWVRYGTVDIASVP